MRDHLEQLIQTAVKTLQKQGELASDVEIAIHLERTRDKQHGDFATNIAMVLAKQLRRKPIEVAELIIANLPKSEMVSKVSIAGPGFINFFLTPESFLGVVAEVLSAGKNYGHSNSGSGKRIFIEFVSANPTGPLHVGHGRSAAYGASVSNVLEAAGFQVHREYYVNDAGRQMDILAASVWLRYLESFGAKFDFPTAGYKGEYVYDISAQLKTAYGDSLNRPTAEVFQDLPPDEIPGLDGDKEAHINALIRHAKDLLGKEKYQLVFNQGLQTILADIRDDLSGFGVEYQKWFSEQELKDSHAIETAIEKLKAAGHLYEKEGALWFQATKFGDDKDRVLVRSNGELTYFAADIAYHFNKYERGFDKIIDVLGADHHGYFPRIKAAVEALGCDASKLLVTLVQFAILYRGKQRVQMSTRSGSFVTLRELREEVGNDAARFFYVMRKSEQHMDFDLELAKSQSNDNPVYYIQYAHARICSVMHQLQEKGLQWDEQKGLAQLKLLHEPHEQALLASLILYPEIIESAASLYEPHQLAHYLRDLANDFHTYYNAHQFLVEDEALRNARLCLITAVKQVLLNGLELIGVSAPKSM